MCGAVAAFGPHRHSLAAVADLAAFDLEAAVDFVPRNAPNPAACWVPVSLAVRLGPEPAWAALVLTRPGVSTGPHFH